MTDVHFSHQSVYGLSPVCILLQNKNSILIIKITANVVDINLFCTFRPSFGAIFSEQLKLYANYILVMTEMKNKNRPMSFKH